MQDLPASPKMPLHTAGQSAAASSFPKDCSRIPSPRAAYPWLQPTRQGCLPVCPSGCCFSLTPASRPPHPPTPTKTPTHTQHRVFAAEETAIIQHLPSLQDEGASFFEASSAGNVAVALEEMDAEETAPAGRALYDRNGQSLGGLRHGLPCRKWLTRTVL